MSKTKAQLEAALQIANEALETAKRTIMDLRDEATGWHQEAKRLEDKLADEMQITLTAANTRVHQMADRKPWKLIAIVAVVAFGLGLML